MSMVLFLKRTPRSGIQNDDASELLGMKTHTHSDWVRSLKGWGCNGVQVRELPEPIDQARDAQRSLE